MTTDAMRQVLIDRIPAGARVAVLASAHAYVHYLGSRTLAARVPLAEAHRITLEPGVHVIVEDLDAVAQPEAVLRAVAQSAPARVYGIVANAANVFALLGFLGGAALAPARALIGEELPDLFARAGFAVAECTPIPDPRLNPLDPTGVIDLDEIGVEFDETTGPRLAAAAFIVVAAPA